MLSTFRVTPATFHIAQRPFCVCKCKKACLSKEKKEKCKKVTDKGIDCLLKACSYGGVGLSSMLGGYEARKAGLSPIGCVVAGYIGGMGGGTLKDIVQGRRVYWLSNPTFAWWSLSTSLFGALLWDKVKALTGLSERDTWTLVISLGSLGGCVCSGTKAGIEQGGPATHQIIRGAIYALLCAVVGGIVKDSLLGKRQKSLYPEGFSNVLPPIVAANACYAAKKAGFSRLGVVATAFGTAVPLKLYMIEQYKKKSMAAATSKK